jgi:hypothetical protein
MNMPIPEFQDYLLLINQQVEEENEEIRNQNAGEHEKSDTPTIKDAFPGTFTPHL